MSVLKLLAEAVGEQRLFVVHSKEPFVREKHRLVRGMKD
jgi:hypothetical protein